jgi:hypothetical protein
MRLDEFMPEYDFNERHRITIHAEPSVILQAVKETTPAEIAFVRQLFTLRDLPARVTGRRQQELSASTSLFEQMLSSGAVLLAEETDRELVGGLIGQFWKLTEDQSPPIASAQEFLDFDGADYAKATFNFLIVENNDGSMIVSTETRIAIPDPSARRKFATYWRIIYPGSALIRRMWLRAIKRRAEASAMVDVATRPA